MTELINTLERILQDIHKAENLAKKVTYALCHKSHWYYRTDKMWVKYD